MVSALPLFCYSPSCFCLCAILVSELDFANNCTICASRLHFRKRSALLALHVAERTREVEEEQMQAECNFFSFFFFSLYFFFANFCCVAEEVLPPLPLKGAPYIRMVKYGEAATTGNKCRFFDGFGFFYEECYFCDHFLP